MANESTNYYSTFDDRFSNYDGKTVFGNGSTPLNVFSPTSPKLVQGVAYLQSNNQLKIFGVHTIVDGEQFAFHNERDDRYTKYFSVHMLNKEPDQDLVDKITKTFFTQLNVLITIFEYNNI